MRPKRVSMQSSKRPNPIPESKIPNKQQKEKNDDEELEYSVERIVRRRYVHNGKAEYQIKWTGYENLTWEPLENLTNCHELVEEFSQLHEANDDALIEPSTSKNRPMSLAYAERVLAKPRLNESGFKLSKEKTPKDGNCFLHGILDQIRYVQLYVIHCHIISNNLSELGKFFLCK